MINLEFGDEILSQVETIAEKPLPDGTSSKDIKFDAKGTPHIMARDGEGKLLHDYPITESKWSSEGDSLQTANIKNEELALLIKQNKTANMWWSFLLAGVGILIFLTVIVMSTLV